MPLNEILNELSADLFFSRANTPFTLEQPHFHVNMLKLCRCQKYLWVLTGKPIKRSGHKHSYAFRHSSIGTWSHVMLWLCPIFLNMKNTFTLLADAFKCAKQLHCPECPTFARISINMLGHTVCNSVRCILCAIPQLLLRKIRPGKTWLPTSSPLNLGTLKVSTALHGYSMKLSIAAYFYQMHLVLFKRLLPNLWALLLFF